MVRVAPITLGQGANRVKWWIVFLQQPPANGSNSLVSGIPPAGNDSPGGGSGVNPPVNLNPPSLGGPTTVQPLLPPTGTGLGSSGNESSAVVHNPEPPGIILGALAGLTALACVWRQRKQSPPFALA